MRICARLLTPQAGTLQIDGRVGYCPQIPGLHELLTADEHLALFSPAMGLTASEGVARGRELLAEFGFPVKDHGAQIRHLSGGCQQKLNLTLALLGGARLLLLDEPYQGFDHGSYMNFWDHVDALEQAGHRGDRRHPHARRPRSRRPRRLADAGPRREPRMSDAVCRRGATLAGASPLGRARAAAGRDGRPRARPAPHRAGAADAAAARVLCGVALQQLDYAPVLGGIAMAFSISGAAIFCVMSSRRLDSRLVLSGYRPRELMIGRLLLLEALGALVALVFSGVIVLGSHPGDPGELLARRLPRDAVRGPVRPGGRRARARPSSSRC